MDSELKKKWIARLRDPNTKQGQYNLKTSYGFCCLGVLCDLVDPNIWRLDHDVARGRLKEFWLKEFWAETSTYLPNQICASYDLPKSPAIPTDLLSEEQKVRVGRYYLALHSKDVEVSHLNDRSFSFLEIADLIEKSDL